MSQRNMLDSSLTIPFIGVSYGVHFPSADLAIRTGTLHSMGGQFGIKFKSNLYIGFKMDYVFGNTVKEPGVLDNIRTSQGGIIEIGGQQTDPILDMEGYSVSLMAGYLFPVLGPNPNSGFLVAAGPCFLQHRIQIDYRDAQIPQLEDDYIYGYDRLSNGFGLNEFVGYIFFSKRKLINLYGGFDFIQTWTKNKREFNYDEGIPDTKVRKDNSIGFRLGMMLTLYRRAPQQYYYR